jgi:hypothetical protein
MRLCDYGCGQEAKYPFKNGKWCCSKNHTQCPTKRKESSLRMIKIRENQNSVFNSILYKKKKSKAMKEKEPWNKGKKGIQVSWNKGKTGVYSKEALKKMSENSKKKNLSEETLKKMSESRKGKESWNKGKILFEEHRKKISEARKGKEPWNKGKTGVYSKEALKRMSEANKNKKPSEETRKKLRRSTIKNIENRCGQCTPNYNSLACELINDYGKKYNYNFQHAENGGEYHIKELGYWVDGYDQDNNIVIEVDESFHFDHDGNLKEKDVQRQKEIEEYLNCKFIRLKI